MTQILTKVSENIGIIRRISYKVQIEFRMSMYNTLVHPYYKYCTIIWATSRNSHLEKKITSQKNDMRLCNKLQWNARISNTYVNTNVPDIVIINAFQMECFTYK